ncbi:MAG: Single-stranded DNA-binding protein [Nocardia sp.]|uniref:single-stranded DNA-binding protein n=1 Tax=Nocardia sp. TaxID=1821 RepID=UPI0026379A04|nr:single-stranded DNA-binding protein [Nocardia sp.]MCU1642959.1 Single-stranded DNA-binding protein [Nocardia sp.]
MSGEIIVTVVGNLTADPDHRTLPSGQVVANLTVAQNSRVYDRASGEWRDGAAAFMRCVVWNEMADHVAASLTKGTRVIATGRLRQRSYEDRNGATQWITEVMIDDIAASLRFTAVEVQTTEEAEQQEQPARRGKRPLVAAGAGDQPDF